MILKHNYERILERHMGQLNGPMTEEDKEIQRTLVESRDNEKYFYHLEVSLQNEQTPIAFVLEKESCECGSPMDDVD